VPDGHRIHARGGEHVLDLLGGEERGQRHVHHPGLPRGEVDGRPVRAVVGEAREDADARVAQRVGDLPHAFRERACAERASVGEQRVARRIAAQQPVERGRHRPSPPRSRARLAAISPASTVGPRS
jgi:hypothetical protein